MRVDETQFCAIVLIEIKMIKLFQKILPSLMLTVIIVVVGGFVDGKMASAQNVQMSMPMMSPVHCNQSNKEIQNGLPINNTFMPCCVERHDNSGTVIPDFIYGKIKFSQSLMTEQVVCASKAIEQKIYPSSPSPPFQAENISSTIKIE